jgi:hypothetical protein
VRRTGFSNRRFSSTFPPPLTELEDPADFPKRRLKPEIIVVVRASPPVARFVIHQIGRVGDNQVHALARHFPHDGDAVAKDDLTQKGADGFDGGVGDHRCHRLAAKGLAFLNAGAEGIAWNRSAMKRTHPPRILKPIP